MDAHKSKECDNKISVTKVSFEVLFYFHHSYYSNFILFNHDRIYIRLGIDRCETYTTIIVVIMLYLI